MAKVYQRKKNNPYYVEHNVYMQVYYKLRDYDRLKKEKLDILYGSPEPPDGMPRGSDVGNPTEQKVLKMAYIDEQLEAIDQCAIQMRGAYSGKVYDEFDPVKAYWSYDYYNYMHIRKSERDEGPSRRKWGYYKSLFTGMIAKRLKIF